MHTTEVNIDEEVRQYYKYLVLGNFQKSTVDMYCRTLRKFLQFCNTQFKGALLKQDHAQEFLLQRVENGRAWSTINADYSALRKYYKVMKDYPWSLKKLPRPKREKSLPPIISKEEVAKLIDHAPTYKHQVFLTFLYATGARLSEATHIKLVDIDGQRMQVHIHRGKGAKDRKVLITDKLLGILRDYYKVYRPVEYLFNGKRKGTPYSSSAGQWAIKRGRTLAGIKRKCTIHTLRNCYATHHLELGTDLVFLQEQMGHKHLKTTAKYIRLCIERYRNICHPLDQISIHYRKSKTMPSVTFLENGAKHTSRAINRPSTT